MGANFLSELKISARNLSRVGIVNDAFQLIETVTLGSNTSSVTFSSLGFYSSEFKHLQLRISARTTRNASNDGIKVTVNSDTGTTHPIHFMVNSGTSISAQGYSNQLMQIGPQSIAGNTQSTGVFGSVIADILDAYSTNKNKTFRAIGGIGGTFVTLSSTAWINTASITSIKLENSNEASNFMTGSRFSLYGIKG